MTMSPAICEETKQGIYATQPIRHVVFSSDASMFLDIATHSISVGLYCLHIQTN